MFIPLEVWFYVVTACSILLVTLIQLQIHMNHFLPVAIFRFNFLQWLPLSRLLNLAPSTIIVVWRENSEACFVQFFGQIHKLTEYYVNKLWHSGSEQLCINSSRNKSSLIHTSCMLNNIDDFMIFRRNIFFFSFSICKLAITYYMKNEIQPKNKQTNKQKTLNIFQ